MKKWRGGEKVEKGESRNAWQGALGSEAAQGRDIYITAGERCQYREEELGDVGVLRSVQRARWKMPRA